MPYIKENQRPKFKAVLEEFNNAIGDKAQHWTAGELNYLISKMLWTIFEKQKSYQTANELVGVLECIKLELYRRKISEYENLKIVENKDI